MKNILRFGKYTNLSSIKMIAVFFLVTIFFFSKSYALNSSGEGIEATAEILHFVVGIANRGWILLANLAGKFMTNDFVYGSVLGLDKYLYVMWNIVKNFANYMLGFLFLFYILKTIFSSDGTNDIAKKIPRILIAGVLIQASRFLFAVVVDISTIAVAGLGSFPSQFLASNQEFSRNTLSQKFAELGKYKVVIDNKSVESQKRITNTTQELDDNQINKIIDSIMPDGDSLAGPFMYLGLSIFQFQDNRFLNTKDSKNLSSILIDIGINGIVVLVYTFVLFALFITNLLRILVLWIAIPLSPFIVLFKTLPEFDKTRGKMGKLSEMMDIGNILKLLFKPVIFTVYLSLIFIVGITMHGVLTQNKEKIEIQDGGVVIENTSDSSTISADGIFSFSMEGTKTGVANIIVYMMLLFLLMTLARMSISSKTGIGFVDKTMDNINSLGKSLVNNTGFIPIGKNEKGETQTIGISAMKNLVETRVGQSIARLDDDNVDIMREKLGLVEKDLARSAAAGGEQRWRSSQKELTNQEEGSLLLSGTWAESYLPIWIRNNYNKFSARDKRPNETLAMYFVDPQNKRLLQEIMYQLTKNGNAKISLGAADLGTERGPEKITIINNRISEYRIKK